MMQSDIHGTRANIPLLLLPLKFGRPLPLFLFFLARQRLAAQPNGPHGHGQTGRSGSLHAEQSQSPGDAGNCCHGSGSRLPRELPPTAPGAATATPSCSVSCCHHGSLSRKAHLAQQANVQARTAWALRREVGLLNDERPHLPVMAFWVYSICKLKVIPTAQVGMQQDRKPFRKHACKRRRGRCAAMWNQKACVHANSASDVVT